jgi:hypothetical protein
MTLSLRIKLKYASMAKALFLIMSGADSPAKADLGIMSASRALEKNRYEDLKVLLFGPSEEYVTKLNGPIQEAFTKLVEGKAIDSACVFIAQNAGLEDKMKDFGIELLPAGERLSHFVNNGYQVISF